MTEINTSSLPAKTPANGASTAPVEEAAETASETTEGAVPPTRRRGRGTRAVPVVGGAKTSDAATEGEETQQASGEEPTPPKKPRKPRKAKAAATEPTHADFAIYGKMVYRAKEDGHDLVDSIEEMRAMIAVYDLIHG